MNPATYRDCCGSLRGMIAHQSADEKPCGWCAQAEASARLASEAVPSGPRGANTALPVSAEQAALNAAILDAAVLTYEREHGHERRSVTRWKPPAAPVSADEAARNREVLKRAVTRTEAA